MSKSDPNENSRITLLDSPDLIKKKIKRAKTDSDFGLEFGNTDRPEADNLLGIFSIVSGLGKEKAQEECAEMGWGKFKPLLTDALVSSIEPIQSKYYELRKDNAELLRILKEGKSKAEDVSKQTLERVKIAFGFLKDSY